MSRRAESKRCPSTPLRMTVMAGQGDFEAYDGELFAYDVTQSGVEAFVLRLRRMTV